MNTPNSPRQEAPIIIKKYANRRLYNTQTSCYITLDDLYQMIKKGEDFAVRDAKTGEDLTRSVLTQIIVEQESRGSNLLPVNFLKQVITFYDDRMQDFVPHYLEASMKSFSENQDAIRDYFSQAVGGYFPFNELEKMGRQNMEQFEEISKQQMDLWQKAFGMFAPFGGEQSKEDETNK